MNRNILLTGFRGTSAELLVKRLNEYKVLLLPNDKVKDSELLIGTMSEIMFDYVVSFGQKPNIKDKVCIETTAQNEGKLLYTDFDCDKLKSMFEQNDIPVKISHNAGTSFCNALYFNGLEFIRENGLDTKMVFIHIPFEKNITDINSFCEGIRRVLRKCEVV